MNELFECFYNNGYVFKGLNYILLFCWSISSKKKNTYIIYKYIYIYIQKELKNELCIV